MPPRGSKKYDFADTPMRCTVCTGPIPTDKRFDAVTCSEECGKKRTQMLRDRKTQKECPMCCRASTPEERERYRRWRQWEKRGTTDESSNVHLLREVQKLKQTINDMKNGETNG